VIAIMREERGTGLWPDVVDAAERLIGLVIWELGNLVIDWILSDNPQAITRLPDYRLPDYRLPDYPITRLPNHLID
jgi:hypothetical protein